MPARHGGGKQTFTSSVVNFDEEDGELVRLARPACWRDSVAFPHSHSNEPADVQISFPQLPVACVHAGDFLERDLRPLEGACPRFRVPSDGFVAVVVDLDRDV